MLLNAGWIRAYVGDSRAAVALLERAMRLSPVDPAMFLFATALGLAHYTGGRHEEAAEWAGRALRDRPAYLAARRLLATSLAELGLLDAAREAVRALLAVAPDYTVGLAAAHSALRDPALRGRYLDGLRRAGLPG